MQENTLNNPKLGMQLSKHASQLSEGEYSVLLNGHISAVDGSILTITNEPSNLLCSRFKEGFKVIGTLPIISDNKVIYFLVNPVSGESEIGEIVNVTFTDSEDNETHCDDCNKPKIENTPLEKTEQLPLCEYKTLISASCLKFSINNPITATYRKSVEGLTIFFAEKGNPLRYIELFNIPHIVTGFDPENCNLPTYSSELDCNAIKIVPDYSIPCIETIDVVSGGSLNAGTYQFTAAYVESIVVDNNTVNQEVTDYFPVSNPIPIFQKTVTIDRNYKTNKAIKIAINNVDTGFDYFNLVVLKTVDQITTPYLIGTFPISSNTFEFTYTGNNNNDEIALAIDQIFRRKPVYNSARSLTDANNFLFWYDLEEQKPINLQPVINKLELKWATVEQNSNFYNNPINNQNVGYLRDEVYPFGIEFILKNGFTTVVFPLVGRNHTSSEVDEIPSTDPNYITDNTSCNTDQRKYRWQFYNTAPTPSGSVCYDENQNTVQNRFGCNLNPYQFGEFAYWESTAKYPNNPEVWGELCGKPIRHFKFPDNCVSPIINNPSINTFGVSNKIYPIGVQLDIEQLKELLEQAVQLGLITEEQKLNITSYRIKRGNRVGNQSIIAKGIVTDILKSNAITVGSSGIPAPIPGKFIYFPNYGFNDITGADPYLDWVFPFSTGRYTFHSPETSFNNPLLPTEIKTELVLYGKSVGRWTEVEKHAKYRLPKQSVYDTAIALSTIEVAADVALAVAEMVKSFIQEDSSATLDSVNTISQIAGSAQESTLPGIPDPYRAAAIIAASGTAAAGLATYLAVNATAQATYAALQAFHLGTQSYFKFINYFNNWVEIITNFETPYNPAIYYTAVGQYTNHCCPDSNLKFQQKINNSTYLSPGYFSFFENSEEVKINNFKRESSVYLSLSTSFSTETLCNAPTDNSKELFSDGTDACSLNTERDERNIKTLYTSIKNWIPDQYGTIDQIEWIDTGYCGKIDWASTQNSECEIIFGGDTYLSNFSFKKKFPFFTTDRVNGGIDEDVLYRLSSNVGICKYYFNSLSYNNSVQSGNDFVPDFKAPSANLECDGGSYFFHRGKLTLYNYAICNFIVESSYNLNFRHAEDELAKNFYPNISDVPFWTQEFRVPISTDNYYFYNNTYSKQNKENPFYILKNNYSQASEDLRAVHTNRVIYSSQNSWLTYSANDYYDFPLSDGKLTFVKGIEQEAVLVGQENTLKIFNAFIQLQTNLANAQVSTGNMFASKPRQFFKTDLGFGGAKHNQVLSTEFGHFFVNSKNPAIFRTSGESILEITKDSENKTVKQWFVNNLPFNITKDFPEIDGDLINNTYKDFGICMGYDNKFKRIFITKKDYSLLPEFKNKVIYQNGEFIYNNEPIFVDDERYFCNKSWTISYSPLFDQFVSFFSFLPNYYVSNEHYFSTGNNEGLWNHLLTQKSYQVFYGNLNNFLVEFATKNTIINNNLQAIKYKSDFRRFEGNENWALKNDKTFNEALIYTPNQTSGNLKLVVKEKNNLFQFTKYPKITPEGKEILVDNVENLWSFNQFSDISLNNGQPIMKYSCNPTIKYLNSEAISYKPSPFANVFRNNYFQIRLGNSIYSNYNILFHFDLSEQSNSPL